MKMEDLILVGYGGHAKSVADSIERQGLYSIIGYTDKQRYDSKYQYLGTDDVLETYFANGVSRAAIGIGYLGKGDLRQRLYAKLKEIGFEVPVIIDPSSVISGTAIIGEGTFIGKNAVVNADVSIGKMSIINTGAIIEHECRVGDFSHVSVGTVLCGQVEAGKSTFIGANATVIQCMKIEDYTIIPAGATVRRKDMKNIVSFERIWGG
jgi:sugar O-acyltransferase (sialic acid O-acetyltransferase NeuD family)